MSHCGFHPGWSESGSIRFGASLVDEDFGVAVRVHVDPIRSLVSVDVNEAHSLDTRHS